MSGHSPISIVLPSRGRPMKAFDTMRSWVGNSSVNIEVIVSLDSDDPFLNDYKYLFSNNNIIINQNRSAIDAINEGAKKSYGWMIIVVSDDTECFSGWDYAIEKETQGKTDWILKTKDGIQDYIITMPIMDRAYYNRTGYIYHPEFQHLFCDTYLTCVADITGRKITSNLMFKHDHYSVNGTEPDDLHKRNDATWKQGQETFIRLMKQFTPQERARIKDPGMRSWLRNHGV